MIAPFFFMASRSLKNRILSWLRRMRQPRYLLAVLVGIAYFYGFVARHWFRGASMGSGALNGIITPELIEGAAALQILILVILNLCGAAPLSALAFTEPEVFMLFPAPLSRSSLINWKLMRGEIGAAFSGLILGTLAGPILAPGRRGLFTAGVVVAFCVMQIYQTGIRLTKHALAERGVSRLKRVAWTLAGAAALLAVCAGGAWQGARQFALAMQSGSARPQELAAAAGRLLTTGPAGVVTWPARLLMRPAVAAGPAEFALALLPVALLAGIGYVWVHRAGGSILEGALDAARRAAEARGAGGRGRRMRRRVLRVTRQPFALRPVGRQEVALVWKWLIALMRTPAESFGLLIGICIAMVMPPTIMLLTGNMAVIPTMMASTALMLLVISLLAGPQTSRGMSQELRYLDVYRSMPVTGRTLVLGLLLAPVATLTLAQWLLLVVVLAAGGPSVVRGMGLLPLAACGAGAALLVVPINLLGALLHSAASILWPSWVVGRPAGRGGGIDVFGLNIINSLARTLTLLIVLLPAGLAVLAVWLGASHIIGTFGSLALGAIPAAGILATEAWVGILLLGRQFERLDPSREIDSFWQHSEIS